MYYDNVIIEIVEDEVSEEESSLCVRELHYCFDVLTENNNIHFRISLLCYISFIGSFMYVFLNNIIYFAE